MARVLSTTELSAATRSPLLNGAANRAESSVTQLRGLGNDASKTRKGRTLSVDIRYVPF